MLFIMLMEKEREIFIPAGLQNILQLMKDFAMFATLFLMENILDQEKNGIIFY